MKHRLTLILEKQPEGGFTITCEQLPELITECDTLDDAIGNAIDAFCSVAELYEQENRVLPTLVKGDAKFTHTRLPHIDISHSAESNLKSDSKRQNPLTTSEALELNYLAMAVSLNELPNSGEKTKSTWM